MSFAHPDFLWAFALVLGAFAFVPRRLRLGALLASSWGFYLVAPTWHFGVLFASTALDYLVGLALDRTGARPARRALLLCSVAGNLGLLVTAKATGWLALGLSFYTFQSLAYSIDVYRRRLDVCRDPVAFALYVAFFPQLLAGPIERAQSLLQEIQRLARADAPVFRAADLERGATLIAWGLLKKRCLSDALGPWAIERFTRPEGHDVLELVLALLSFNVLLYLDFSAYTDVARGAARCFGVRLVGNFRRPYFARTLGDLMRRWHTSLVDWIMDYVWVPMVAGRLTLGRVALANCVVLALFGLWHDLRLDLALLGAANGLIVTFEQLPRLLRRRPTPRSLLRAVLAWVLMAALWIVFSTAIFAPDGASVVRYLRATLEAGAPGSDSFRWLGLAAVGTAAALWLHGLDLFGGEDDASEQAWSRVPCGVRLGLLAVALFLVARFGAESSSEFVYVRF